MEFGTSYCTAHTDWLATKEAMDNDTDSAKSDWAEDDCAEDDWADCELESLVRATGFNGNMPYD